MAMNEVIRYRGRQTAFHLAAKPRNQRAVFRITGRRKWRDRVRPSAERIRTIAVKDMQEAGEHERLRGVCGRIVEKIPAGEQDFIESPLVKIGGQNAVEPNRLRRFAFVRPYLVVLQVIFESLDGLLAFSGAALPNLPGRNVNGRRTDIEPPAFNAV